VESQPPETRGDLWRIVCTRGEQQEILPANLLLDVSGRHAICREMNFELVIFLFKKLPKFYLFLFCPVKMGE
jgi:hypothetical protein